MAIKNSVAVYIDGINRTSKTVMPFKWGDFLDERLDESNLSLRAIKKKNFAPLTPVDVIITNEHYYGFGKNRKVTNTQQRVIHYIVANDVVSETQLGSGLYNHELSLIEVTKAAERVVVDSLTYTNDLGRNYTANAQIAEPRWE